MTTSSKKGRLAPVTYAKVGGPPMDWQNFCVWLGDEQVQEVVEVDSEEGWALVHDLDDEGHSYPDPLTGELAVRRIEGAFEIRRRT